MENISEEYFTSTIRPDTHNPEWTQFEMDLIRCIRDDYPIIYTNVENMTRHQRAGKVRSAWKEISEKFKEISGTYIKARWRSILDNYLKVKIFDDGSSVNKKFMDGTLSFLEGQTNLLEHQISEGTSHNDPNKEHSDDDLETLNKYEVDIRESLHEEVDIENEVVEVKDEVIGFDDNVTTAEEENKITTQKKWTEEELLNATRLTKEMIDQLILIKTRNYYMAPMVTK